MFSKCFSSVKVTGQTLWENVVSASSHKSVAVYINLIFEL